MKKFITIVGFIIIPILFGRLMISCSTVPLTGRHQLNLLPESELMAMGITQYDEFLKENRLSSDQNATRMVKKVGNKIAQAVEAYLKENGMSDRIAGYKWEFNLVENEVPNAWCMPGGKVVVYTGILPVTQDENGLAVVLGHEISHAVARHGNERMSQSLLIQMGGIALSTAIDQKPEETKALFMTAYGVGTAVGISLPYSRAQETEADKLGLIFMAMANYDPHGAIEFWQRMANTGGQKPPEFLSTHPADETRVRNLENFLPEALKYYQP